MATSVRRRLGAAAILAAAALAVPGPAYAEPAPLVLPAGLACDFELRLDFSAEDQRDVKEFTDANGETVRVIKAGRGQAITFTNVETDVSVSLKGNGAVERTTINADGTRAVQSTGHNVLILFPSDVPAGPSTTLYVGRVTYTIGTDGVFTLTSSSGQTTDICAALAP